VNYILGIIYQFCLSTGGAERYNAPAMTFCIYVYFEKSDQHKKRLKNTKFYLVQLLVCSSSFYLPAIERRVVVDSDNFTTE